MKTVLTPPLALWQGSRFFPKALIASERYAYQHQNHVDKET